jgi:transcriptional regulator of acetoin/glycerol metabolism
MRDLAHRGADWSERVLGNNGPGTAALTGQLAAFTGREHFSPRLHPYATVGLPLEDPSGRMAGVIGLLGDRNVGASVLLGVMGLIVRLLAAETPLRQPGGAGTALRFSSHRLNPGSSRTEPGGSSTNPPRYTDTLAESLVWQAVSLQNRNIPILITGESGAGKEHLVRLVHLAGCRSRGPLVAINCASIPRDLIESELFGYEGGSFTGARSQGKPGKFQLADGGVLFLDEIGDMSFDLQATLLRVLESSEFVPVGGTRPLKVDVHVIAATNVRLLDAVEQGRFRRDLYYRLNGAQLRLPPLRERPDKRALIDYLLARECELAHVPLKQLSPELRGLFDCHPWPGNIRELRNLLRNLVSIISSEVLTVHDLPEDFLEDMHALPPPTAAKPAHEPTRTESVHSGLSAPPSMEDWECHAIEDALRRTGGNVAETARTLGISRSTLYLKLQRYKLVPDRRCR